MTGKPANNQTEPAVAFENVSKGFASQKVIDDVSFALPAGETLCVLGRSGTGKSVTLRMMIGLIKPDSGHVKVMGNDVGALNEEGLAKMRRKMGFLFQSAALFDSFSVWDNLALPLHRLDKGRSNEDIANAVEEALASVGLEKACRKMPSELSGGMQKRAGLARALVLQPEILLIDEPSSGLDRITASEIDDLLLKIKAERHSTIVIVTHDIHGARRVGDKFLVLDQSKLLAFGSPQELDQQGNEHLNQFISESGR